MTLAGRLGWLVGLAAAAAGVAPVAVLTYLGQRQAQEVVLAETAVLRGQLEEQAAAWSQRLLAAGEAAARSGPFPVTAAARQEWAAAALSAAGLDLLWVLDGDGRILACAHWPARVDGRRELAAPEERRRPRGERIIVQNREVSALLAARPLAADGAELWILAGLDLEAAARAAMTPAATTALTIVAPESGADANLLDDGTVAAQVAVAPGSGFLLAGRRRLAGLPLPTLPVLALLAAVPALLLGLVAAALARRAMAPVAELDRMAAALAGGRLNLELDTGDGGELDGLATSVNRMTAALRRQRRELETTARLAAWRDAARRLAHEVKNPLAPIRMAVENLGQARRQSPEEFAHLFEEECRTILAEVDALNRLVGTFSRFARLPEPQRRSVPVSAPLEQVSRLHRGDDAGVELLVEAASGAGEVTLDPDLMGQVLKNLVLNALAVVPRPGGCVTLACGGDEDEVFYRVSDNGPGIPPAIRDRLFEPQVTARRGGTGLGLAVARQIVDAHGGSITVATGAAGTRFTVTLPRRPAAAGKEA